LGLNLTDVGAAGSKYVIGCYCYYI